MGNNLVRMKWNSISRTYRKGHGKGVVNRKQHPPTQKIHSDFDTYRGQ